MKKSTLFFFLISQFFLSKQVHAQGEQVFDNATTHEIYLTFSDTNFWTTLTNNYDNNYPNIPYIMANAVIDGEAVDSIGVRLKGFSSYFIETPKKSIKLDFNEFVKGKKYDGLKKLNLNNGEGDPAILRDKLSYDILRESGVSAPRTSYARVYLNGSYWGLYLLVEQVDKTFLQDNFGSDQGNLFKNMGFTRLDWEGRDTALYQQNFELKTKPRAGAWDRFVNFVDVLNNSSNTDFKTEISQVFDVELYLKVLAVDIATSNWDSYLEHGRNFYVYENPASKKFQWIPWDYNLSMGGTFSSAGGTDTFPPDSIDVSQCPTIISGECPYPVTDTIMQQVMTRDPFCCNDSWDGACQDFYNRLASGDTTGSGGGFSSFTSFPIKIDTSSKVLIKRLLAVPEFQEIYYQNWCRLLEDNFTTERLFPIIDTAGNQIRAHIQADPNYPWTLQNFEGDLDQGNDTIPGLKKFIQDRITVFTQELAPLYDCNQLTSSLTFKDVVINEFCASCDSLSGLADPAGEYDDWIELYNTTNAEVDLSLAYLSDKIENPRKWAFPAGTLIPANGYLIIWADEDEGQAGLHSNFKLSKSGEALILTDNNTVLDSLSFGPQTSNITASRVPNGSGNFTLVSPTFNAHNDWTTGIQNSLGDELKVNVYPNPTDNHFTIDFEKTPPIHTQATLSNMLGQTVLQKQISAARTRFSVQTLPAGIYILKVENPADKSFITRKLEIY